MILTQNCAHDIVDIFDDAENKAVFDNVLFNKKINRDIINIAWNLLNAAEKWKEPPEL